MVSGHDGLEGQVSSIMALKRKTKGPFRMTSPSPTKSTHTSLHHSPSSSRSPSPSPSVTSSISSSTSAPPSRLPSVLSSATSTTSSDPDSAPEDDYLQTEPEVDVNVKTPPLVAPPSTVTEAIKQAKLSGNYFPSDHFLFPPTPDQLSRRKRQRTKPRKLFYTFVRQHARPHAPRQPQLYIQPSIRNEVKESIGKRRRLEAVVIPKKHIRREEYVVNSKEFILVKVVRRVYKVSRRGRRRYGGGEKGMQMGMEDEGIGIAGYVIRFADGHEHTFPVSEMDSYVNRYPGLLTLLEEYEHLTLAREEGDRAAASYFKRERRLREDGFEVGAKLEDDDIGGRMEVPQSGERMKDEVMNGEVKEELLSSTVQTEGFTLSEGNGKGKALVTNSSSMVHSIGAESLSANDPVGMGGSALHDYEVVFSVPLNSLGD